MSNRDDAEGMVDRAVQTFGQMDIIVNNAGIMDNLLPIAEMDDDVWERLMKVNLNSVMYGTRKAVRYFMERGEGGVIINTASLSGLCAGRGGCAYTASKFAVVGLTKNVAFMYADTGIRCNAICPGNTQTNIGVGMRQPSERGMARQRRATPAPPPGTPEISAAAVFWPPTRPASSTARPSPSTAAGARTRPRAYRSHGSPQPPSRRKNALDASIPVAVNQHHELLF
ncbi:MAG: SDR family NAD(P)-dependent oxidoreductase [Eggerthella lenta]